MTDQMRELIKKAAEALKEAGAREVYLFGSAATGTMRADSDIDMAVSGLPPEHFFKAMGEAHGILGRQLDLIDLDEKNSQNISKRRGSFILSSELREEIELEVAELRQLLGSFRPLREKILNVTPEFVEISALAGFLHAFYTGIENLFKRITIHLDGGPPRGEAWHTQLLESMARCTKNRPAVISDSLVGQLRSYLDFRHSVRPTLSIFAGRRWLVLCRNAKKPWISLNPNWIFFSNPSSPG